MLKGFKEMGIVPAMIKITQLTGLSVQTVGGITKGVMLLETSKIEKEVGEIKAAEELIQQLIHLLEQTLRNLQGGMDSRSEMIVALEQDFNNLCNAESMQMTKLFQANLKG